ncbi:unnamed protein product [Vitrella brassicaformis CCMP3155]|uniref:Pentacotripeptide-repeat region of PRORP domain-containing protein n=1 Tax=Vitrella brassicaformis (strain CCMP3155) TaxID=1169540 RepID=A0A0G4FY20_VITBC|nr:unnamed protein product [Vitrella brassicaformis CCMP3155]|eukprot:CEM20049.1 unnamed protein product [Vitrella brassicaformis CCMP3155]
MPLQTTLRPVGDSLRKGKPYRHSPQTTTTSDTEPLRENAATSRRLFIDLPRRQSVDCNGDLDSIKDGKGLLPTPREGRIKRDDDTQSVSAAMMFRPRCPPRYADHPVTFYDDFIHSSGHRRFHFSAAHQPRGGSYYPPPIRQRGFHCGRGLDGFRPPHFRRFRSPSPTRDGGRGGNRPEARWQGATHRSYTPAGGRGFSPLATRWRFPGRHSAVPRKVFKYVPREKKEACAQTDAEILEAPLGPLGSFEVEIDLSTVGEIPPPPAFAPPTYPPVDDGADDDKEDDHDEIDAEAARHVEAVERLLDIPDSWASSVGTPPATEAGRTSNHDPAGDDFDGEWTESPPAEDHDFAWDPFRGFAFGCPVDEADAESGPALDHRPRYRGGSPTTAENNDKRDCLGGKLHRFLGPAADPHTADKTLAESQFNGHSQKSHIDKHLLDVTGMSVDAVVAMALDHAAHGRYDEACRLLHKIPVDTLSLSSDKASLLLEAAAGCGDVCLAETFFQGVGGSGMLKAYADLLRTYSKAGDKIPLFNVLPDVVDYIQRQKLLSADAALTSVLHQSLVCGDHELAELLFDYFQEEGAQGGDISGRVKLYATMVKGYSSACLKMRHEMSRDSLTTTDLAMACLRKADDCLDFCARHGEEGFATFQPTCIVLFGRAAAAWGQLALVWKWLLPTAGQPARIPATLWLLLLDHMTPESTPQDIHNMLKLVNNIAVETLRPVSVFNAVIDFFLHMNEEAALEKFLNEYESSLSTWEVTDYGHLIRGFGRLSAWPPGRRADKAMSLWASYFRSLGPFPFAALKGGCSADGRLPIVAYPLCCLMDALCLGGRPLQAFRLFQSLDCPPVGPLPAILIRGFADVGDGSTALTVYRMAINKGIRPNQASVNAMVYLYVRSRDMGHAMAIFRDMNRSRLCPPNLSTITLVVKGLAESDQAGRVDDVVRAAKDLHLPITPYIASQIANAQKKMTCSMAPDAYLSPPSDHFFSPPTSPQMVQHPHPSFAMPPSPCSLLLPVDTHSPSVVPPSPNRAPPVRTNGMRQRTAGDGSPDGFGMLCALNGRGGQHHTPSMAWCSPPQSSSPPPFDEY